MSRRRVLAPAIAAASAYVLLGVELAAFGPVIAEWMRDFGVGPATVGTVFSASALGSVAATLAYAPLVHRWDLRRALAAGAAVFGLGLALAAAAPDPLALLAGFVVAGTGFALLDSGVNHLYVRLFPGVRAAALNVVHLFFALGAAAAPVALAAALPLLGWRPVYGALSGAALLTAAALYLSCPAGGDDGAAAGPWLRSGRVLQALVGPALAMALYVGVEVTVSGWAYSFLAQEAGAPPLLAGAGISIFWAGLAVGRLLLGPAVERVGYRPSLVAAAAVAGAMLLATVLPLDSLVAAALLGLSGLAMSVIFPTLVALASTLVPPGDTATATAVMLLSASAGTMSLPALAGLAAGWTGLRPVMAALGALLPAGFAVLLGLTKAGRGRAARQDSVRASSAPVKRTRRSASLKAASPTTAQRVETAARRASSAPVPNEASQGLHPAADGLKVRRMASSQ